MNPFYINLYSGSSSKLYPSNNGSKFINKLPEDITLSEDCCVGLSQVSYNNNFYNIKNNRDSLHIFDMLYCFEPHTKDNPSAEKKYGKYFMVDIQEGFYSDPVHFCKYINEKVKKSGVVQLKDKNVFSYNPVRGKFSYDIEGFWGSIWMRGEVLFILGADSSKHKIEYGIIGHSKVSPTYTYNNDVRKYLHPEKMFEATTSITKDEFMYVSQVSSTDFMNIYLDVIQPQICGDQFAQLLKSISIEGKIGQRIVKNFDKPFYVPLNTRFLSSIECHIKDLYDDFLTFNQGIVSLTLHIKPLSHAYY